LSSTFDARYDILSRDDNSISAGQNPLLTNAGSNMVKPRIICWDLDETLGFFRDIMSVRKKLGFPDPDDSYVLRTDIVKTLNRMLDKGYRHVVTSSAKLYYTKGIIEAVCLDAYFERIFGRKDVTDGIWGKKYLPAAELYGLDEAEARSNMLVIANMAGDEPVDLDIVFLHDERPLEESALAYFTIAERLWELGECSFKRGFDELFETGRRITSLDKDFDFVLASANIPSGITIDMGYKNSPCTEGLRVPVVMNIRSG
jgi:hypothetical protein